MYNQPVDFDSKEKIVPVPESKYFDLMLSSYGRDAVMHLVNISIYDCQPLVKKKFDLVECFIVENREGKESLENLKIFIDDVLNSVVTETYLITELQGCNNSDIIAKVYSIPSRDLINEWTKLEYPKYLHVVEMFNRKFDKDRAKLEKQRAKEEENERELLRELIRKYGVPNTEIR